MEKRKLFHIFLKQFLTIFRNWKPFNLGQTPKEALTLSPTGYVEDTGEVVGCNLGHPTEVILILTEEVSKITRLLSDSKLLHISMHLMKLLLMPVSNVFLLFH